MENALINKEIVTIYGVPQLDLLTEENQKSTIQDEGLYGMPVQILERYNGEWAKIKTHYRYEGYVQLKDLKLLSEQEFKDWEKSDKQVVMKSYIDVLACPKVQGIRLTTLTKGAIVICLEHAKTPGGWATIKLNDGQKGYVKDGFLGPYYSQPIALEEEALRQQIVQTALSYLGSQYRWGGKTPLGIDCSGLTSMAYLLNGIVIYRDAKLKEGFPVHEIAFKDKKPADLFYYPGHISMYIGNNKYIHSTGRDGSDGVVINSLDPNEADYREDLPALMYAVGSVF